MSELHKPLETKKPVSFTTLKEYDAEKAREALLKVLNETIGLDWIRPGMRIGIKLNLCTPAKVEKAATTNPVLAAELCRILVERGAKVVVGDSPGEPFTAAVMNLVYNMGGMKLVEEAGGELNRNYEHHRVSCPEATSLKSFDITDWITECDAVINFCKLKSHGLMGMTAATKNMFGVIPGTEKPETHFLLTDPLSFAHGIVDLGEYVKPVLHLVDAVTCMEGNGPTQGTPRDIGVIGASISPYELDRSLAWLIDRKEEELLFLEAAKIRGLLSRDGEIHEKEFLSAYRLTDFKRSGATASWFGPDEGDSAVKRTLKKGLAVLLRSKPALEEGCVGCGHCQKLCPAGAITIKNKKAVIDRKKCVRCFCCQEFCPTGAMKAKRSFVARLLVK